MPTSIVSTRGQTVIPKPVREHLGLHPGDQVDFVIQEDGEVIVKPVSGRLSDLKGILHVPGRKPVSLEEMKSAIRHGACRK